MKFTIPHPSNYVFKLARMAKEGNRTTAAPKEMGSWGILQLLGFTLFGAMVATFISSQSPLPQPAQQQSLIAPNPISASNVKILSFEPLIAHITDFVSASERAHLLKLGSVLPRPPSIPN
jgi:prolyl 4-hydroxylase